MKYLERKNNYSVKDQLDSEIRKERNYWRQVLKRVVAVICTLIEKTWLSEDPTKVSAKNPMAIL